MHKENKERIIASLYKILPLYEEYPNSSYMDYLETIIPIFKGYVKMNLIDIEVLGSIVGLYESGSNIEHKMVKRIVMRAIHSVNEKGRNNNDLEIL